MSGDQDRRRSEQRDDLDRSPTDVDRDTHGTASSPAVSPERLYADPAWIAANLPELRRKVVKGLRTKGFSAEQAEEAFAEAIVRLYVHLPNRRTPRSVLQWLALVAYRTGMRRTRAEMLGLEAHKANDWPEVTTETPETVVEERDRWHAVVEETVRMRDKDRLTLLWIVQRELVAMGAVHVADALAAHLGEPEPPSGRMRRVRARQQLRRRLDGLPGWVGGVSVPRLLRDRISYEGLLAAAAAALVGAVSMMAGNHVPSSATDWKVPTPSYIHGSSTMPPSLDDQTSHGANEHPATASRGRRGPSSLVTSAATGRGPTPIRMIRQEVPGTDTVIYGSDRPPGSGFLICVRNSPVLGDVCVQHPLAAGWRPDENSCSCTK